MMSKSQGRMTKAPRKSYRVNVSDTIILVPSVISKKWVGAYGYSYNPSLYKGDAGGEEGKPRHIVGGLRGELVELRQLAVNELLL